MLILVLWWCWCFSLILMLMLKLEISPRRSSDINVGGWVVGDIYAFDADTCIVVIMIWYITYIGIVVIMIWYITDIGNVVILIWYIADIWYCGNHDLVYCWYIGTLVMLTWHITDILILWLCWSFLTGRSSGITEWWVIKEVRDGWCFKNPWIYVYDWFFIIILCIMFSWDLQPWFCSPSCVWQ